MNSTRRLRSLLITGLAFANVVVFALSGFALHQTRQQYNLRAQTTTQNVVNALNQSVSSSVEKLDLAMRSVVDELERQLAGKGIDEQATNAFLARLAQRLPEVEAFRVADAEGFVILGKGVNRQARVSWADRDYFKYHQTHADGALQISNPRVGRVAQQYIIGFARRYNYPDGRFAGVLSAPIAVDHFANLLSRFDLGPKGLLVLRYADLGLIARNPPMQDHPVGQIGNASVSKELRELVESGVHSATYHLRNSPDGFERINSYQRVENAPMITLAGMASENYLADWWGDLYKTSALALGFLLLSGVMGAILLRLLAQFEQNQQRLLESENRLRTIIANEPECIKIIDAEGRLLEMNPAGLAMIEADAIEQVAGLPVLDVIAPEYRKTYAEIHQRIIAGESVKAEYEVLGLKGGRRLLETHAVPMRDNGAVVHLAVTRDISERRAYENALKQAKAEAEAANLAKSAFLATMSHEIRTPMNGILGMAQLLLLPDLPEHERIEYARTVHNSGQTLLRLLNDILDLSKVEAGKLELSLAAFSPHQIADETVALFAEHAHAKGLVIEAAWRGAEGQRYLGDAVRLRQMVANLISNAIKFTAQGYVHLEVAEIERDGSRALLEFVVSDSGIGIPADRIGLLFKPFSQIDSSSTRQHGGTGLGLSIISSLTRLMSGTVGVESTVGQGSRFWFRVRADLVQSGEETRQAERLPYAQQASVPVAPTRGQVLIVEDNQTNGMVAAALLRRLGVQSQHLENGQQAVDAILGGMQPDLILMDVHMPVLDGIKATQAIRQWESDTWRERMPIVALTASAFAEDQQRCLAVGMNDFLTKPLDIEALSRVLAKWLPKPA
ncbi:hypothetical protein MASR1M60_31150 [Rhodocyclaceae bacterium]